MKSKIKNSIFVIATSLASAAFFSQTATAGESGYPVLQSISEKTTAQVKEELRKAKESGELSTSDSAYPILESAEAPKTRSEVKAELKQARTSEELRKFEQIYCLLYTSPSPRDVEEYRMPSSA